MVFISWLGLSSNLVHADEVDYTWLGSWRYPTDSGYQSLPATDLNFGIEYELRLQYIPKYQFQTNHYYDIKLEFAHSYGTFNFDHNQYQAGNGYTVPVGTPTITSFNPDMYNTTVIIKSVNPDNAQRILNRIRFYFMVTPQNNGSTTTGSIHVGLTHLYIDDTTADNTIIEINDTVKDTNQKTGSILQKIIDLPNNLRDMLLGFFVPTSDEIDDFFDDFNDLVYLRLGCVAQTLDFFGNIIDSFIHATAEDQIYIPRLAVWIPINSGQVVSEHTLILWAGGYINVMPSEWHFAADNINYIRTIIDIICLFMLFRYLINVFHSIVSPEVTESMTMHEILEELEMRTLD